VLFPRGFKPLLPKHGFVSREVSFLLWWLCSCSTGKQKKQPGSEKYTHGADSPKVALNLSQRKSYNLCSLGVAKSCGGTLFALRGMSTGKESAMKRHLCVSLLFALALVPDWSAACDHGGMPAYGGGYYAPVYSAPVYYPAPVYQPPVYMQPVYVQPSTPMKPPVLQPPRVEQSKAKPGSALTEPARPLARPMAPAKPPEIEPIRPASGVTDPADVAKPQAAVPSPKPKLPPIEAPKNEGPKWSDPTPPKNDSVKPRNPLKIGPDPALPSLELPGGPAVPSPAPGPDSLIPTPSIPVPKNESLPPLTLPPDTPAVPSPAPAPEKTTEVKSSPLTAARELKVSVFPATGVVAANGLRKVGFYNHTNRDLSLTIEGRTVTLPAMTYLHAQLPPAFTWKCADKAAEKATIPANASGLDVLIRE
jgi:hypothetical protein